MVCGPTVTECCLMTYVNERKAQDVDSLCQSNTCLLVVQHLKIHFSNLHTVLKISVKLSYLPFTFPRFSKAN